MVDVAGLVGMVNNYRWHSRQGWQALLGKIKPLPIQRLLEQPMFYFAYIAFAINQAMATKH